MERPKPLAKNVLETQDLLLYNQNQALKAELVQQIQKCEKLLIQSQIKITNPKKLKFSVCHMQRRLDKGNFMIDDFENEVRY